MTTMVTDVKKLYAVYGNEIRAMAKEMYMRMVTADRLDNDSCIRSDRFKQCFRTAEYFLSLIHI